MCGRYALIDGKRVLKTFAELQALKQLGKPFELLPRYNASPMQPMPVIAVRNNERIQQAMRWWLVPHWSADGKPNPQFPAFNARAETIHTSKLFAPYFKSSRCLVPADAFYEWKKLTATKEVRGTTKEIIEKQPMCIRMEDEAPFMFAGLFSVWKNKNDEEFPTFTIITTEPNSLMSEIHQRMPVILPEQHFDQWLDREYKETEPLKKFLIPYPATKMKAYRVAPLVGNSRNDVPGCMEPIEE